MANKEFSFLKDIVISNSMPWNYSSDFTCLYSNTVWFSLFFIKNWKKKKTTDPESIVWVVSNISWAPNRVKIIQNLKDIQLHLYMSEHCIAWNTPLCNGTHVDLSVCNSQSWDMFWKCIFDFGSSKKSWEEVKTERLFETLQKACVLPETINYQLSCQSLQKWIKKPQKAVT